MCKCRKGRPSRAQIQKQTGNPSKEAREERDAGTIAAFPGYLIRHSSRLLYLGTLWSLTFFASFFHLGQKLNCLYSILSHLSLSILFLFLFLFSSPISYLAVQLHLIKSSPCTLLFASIHISPAPNCAASIRVGAEPVGQS